MPKDDMGKEERHTEHTKEDILKDFHEFFDYLKEWPKDAPIPPMAFGIECGDGWADLLYQLCTDIKSELEDGETFAVQQIKEKFGGLRFYCGPARKEVHDLIAEAEKRSYTVCERCGKPGKVRDTGWIRTLCDDCHEPKGGK